MRQLKFHEKKLLKKVNFLQWKNEHNHREVEVMRRYHLQDRDDYKKYNKLCGMVTKLVNVLKQMDPRDPAASSSPTGCSRSSTTWAPSLRRRSLALCDKLSVSSFCRRRLSVIMVRLKMAETLREAVTFIEQGHVRVGPETVTDPAFS